MCEVREPLVDLFDEGEQIAVIVELPGVTDAEIQVLINGDVLAIETNGERRYAKELVLPAPADPAPLQRSYRNGILELRLRKHQDPPAGGRPTLDQIVRAKHSPKVKLTNEYA